MASPDITPYVDLTLNDKDPQEIFDTALSSLTVKLPDWQPREGNTEVLLMEALSLEVAELIFALNRVPSAVVETFLRLFGVERDAGAPPTVTLKFNMSGTQGYTIPSGVSVRLDLTGGLEPLVFTTETELDIPAGQTSGTISATGDRFTSEGNGVSAGALVELLDSVIYVDSVETFSTVGNGRDAETDAVYFERAVQRLGRLTDTLVLPRHFVAAALEEVYTKRAFSLDNYNPASDPDNNGPVGNDPGHFTLAVYGDSANVSAANKTALEAKLESLALANLDIHLIDPTITTVPVTVTVAKYAEFDSGTVIANIAAALNSYLDPMQWGWGAVVRRNELIQVISNAEGVDYVSTLTAPAADVTLAGVAPLADAGTINVTVL